MAVELFSPVAVRLRFLFDKIRIARKVMTNSLWIGVAILNVLFSIGSYLQ